MPARRQRHPTAVEPTEAIDTRPYAACLVFRLPFPTSVNQTYKIFAIGGHAKMAKTKEAKEYEAAAAKTIRAHLAHLGQRAPLPPYKVEIRAFPPNDGKKHDLDNTLKLLLDSVFRPLGIDDNHIVHLEIRKPWKRRFGDDEAGVVITITGEAEEPDAL